MRDRCNKNDRQHFIGDKSSAIHVCGYGGANVQGRVILYEYIRVIHLHIYIWIIQRHDYDYTCIIIIIYTNDTFGFQYLNIQ